MLYLDHNATTPLLPAVRRAMDLAWDEAWANPSSPHAWGRRAQAALENARAEVAALVGRPPVDVTFTGGATEANSWLLAAFSRRGPIVASSVEHPSVSAWANVRLPVDERGVVDLEALEGALEHAAILSVMAANNETGVLQPIAEAGQMARRRGIPFHVDATQLPGKVVLPVEADFVTLSAHKFGGPKGVGCLVGKHAPAPLLVGGSQERGRRAGTVNVPGIVGMGVAANLAMGATIDPCERDRLEALCVSLGARVLGEGAPRLPNTSLVLFEGIPGDLIVMALDLEGIGASTGSACASGAHETSAVLQAMGVEGTPVRFSLAADTDVGPALDVLPRVIDRLRAHPAESYVLTGR